MSNQDFNTNNTGTALATMDAASVRKLWKQGAQAAEANADFFQQMEGGTERSLIWAQTDLAKGVGQEMTFTTESGFYNEPKYGEALFETKDDFESVDIASYGLKVDFVRNAVRSSERMEEVMGMRGEIASKFNVKLGDWLGRLKTDQVLATSMLKLNKENVLYANGKTLDTLSSADTLAWDEVVTGGQAMKPLGGLPANITGANSDQPIWSQTVVATEAALLSLKTDPDYKTVLQNGDVRGRGNTIFKGGYASIDGHTILPFNPIDHDGVGAVGSFLNPKAFLGVAVAAGTAAIDIKGGGNATDAAKTSKLFFKYFPGHAYTFVDTGAYAASDFVGSAGEDYDTETKYFLICNTSGSDAGKFGMYSYTTGNNGNKITITGRLNAAASGIGVTTLGSVVWNTGVWLNKHTDAHPIGSLIVPCNAKGVPFGDTLFLGQAFMLRGYGKHRAKRSQDELNGGMITDRYITSVFGQSLRRDRKQRHPAIVRLRHAITYPGIAFPTVA
ncbi:MAG: hypothetical protein WCO57_13980 [Verrucomicrobiota bacterium]